MLQVNPAPSTVTFSPQLRHSGRRCVNPKLCSSRTNKHKGIPALPGVGIQRRTSDIEGPATKPSLEQPTKVVYHALQRYSTLHNQRDLDDVIAYFERVLHLCPPDHPNHTSILFNLATAKFIHCQDYCHYHDLDEAITLYHDALLLRTKNYPGHCITALDLCFALSARLQNQSNEVYGNGAGGLLSGEMKSYAYQAAWFTLQMSGILSFQAIDLRVSLVGCADLDEEGSIRGTRVQLQDLSKWNACQPAILADMGNSLLRRYHRRGKLVDLQEAVSMLENAVRLTSDRHPGKPDRLLALQTSLMQRFTCLNRREDIDRSISILKDAVRLTPNGHPNRPSQLNSLGSSLSHRFKRFGDVVDIDQSILMFEEAARLTPNGHPDKLAWLSNLGGSLSSRFQRFNDLKDIDNAIGVREMVVHLTSNGDPDRPVRLSNLGHSLFHRFLRLGNPRDLDMSISKLQEAVQLAPTGHPNKPAMLGNLANSLSRRFECLGNLIDINQAISLKEAALGLIPNCHPDKPDQLSGLGNSLHRRFMHLGDLADIEKSISVLDQAIHLVPSDHPMRLAWLNNLASSLSHRFSCLGDLADITKSISIMEVAVRLVPNDHPNKPVLLATLGNSLTQRFERLADVADIAKSISNLEEAMGLTPNKHPHKPPLLDSLGNSLTCRFEFLGNFADIDRCISVFDEALRLTPDGHSNKPARLNRLGNSLLNRFKHLGNLADIDKSISLQEEAVRLSLNSHDDKPVLLNSLGNSLMNRFEHLGDLGDIDRCISMKEQAVCLTPSGHPTTAAMWSSLGNSLLRRFERLGDLEDIEKSILMLNEAVRLTPDDHPNKPTWMNNLGNSLASRYERLDDLIDLNKAVSMKEEASRLTPDSHHEKPIMLNNLGNSLLTRFERLGRLADIDKSLSVFEEALHLTPNGHPYRAIQLTALGNGFIKHFERSLDSAHLAAAVSRFELASRASASPASARFRAARGWIYSARIEGKSQAVLDAFTTAIDLLPQLVWLGLPLAERHRVLLEVADVARDAAAAALEAGCPERAVEWLEQGRSVVWSQFLQLRTPVDALRVAHPALAGQLHRLSRELEHVGSRDSTLPHMSAEHTVADTRRLEDEVQRHHDLALRRETLLVEIRSLPGFERFLLPKTLEQLGSMHAGQVVVYVNASQQRCDALIVLSQSELTKVVPVPLPGVTHPEIQGLRRMLRLLLERHRLIISREDIIALIPSEEKRTSQKLINSLFMRDSCAVVGRAVKAKPQQVEGYTPDELFQRILACLWTEVAKPVLQAIGYTILSSGGKKMPRIFWCPTGPFAFLPIHAAGLYGTTEAGTKLSDFVISSYIPTLSALGSPLQDGSHHPPSKTRLVVVPQPKTDGLSRLSCVKEEIDHIRASSAKSPFVTLQDSCGTVEDVTEKMMNADWVHFACHGVQDPHDPLASGLSLADECRLKLSDIIRLSRPQGGLAFLSACQTAQGDETLAEESVHLAAGMLLAGYGGVIATMWAIRDPDAPRVAKDVYARLFRSGGIPESEDAAEALHDAVGNLRTSGAPFASWVPFIHVGR